VGGWWVVGNAFELGALVRRLAWPGDTGRVHERIEATAVACGATVLAESRSGDIGGRPWVPKLMAAFQCPGAVAPQRRPGMARASTGPYKS
jgi:hypothetical protein